jgi:hypothetical protein
VQVQCESRGREGEYPVRFGHGDHNYFVEDVLDRWYGSEDTYFKVRADDGTIYILRHSPASGTWSLESFRKQ